MISHSSLFISHSSLIIRIGLGASAIGDTFGAFAQNEKTVADYQNAVQSGRLPLLRGHFLTPEDRKIRQHILNLMCRYQTEWSSDDTYIIQEILPRLAEPIADGLVQLMPNALIITPLGMGFLRNVCMAFDMRYWQKQPHGRVFSSAV